MKSGERGCPACGGARVTATGIPWLPSGPEGHAWQECRDCGLIQTDLRPTDELVRTWYDTAPRQQPAGKVGILGRWKPWLLRHVVLAATRRDWRRWPWLLLLHPLLGHFQGLPRLNHSGHVLDIGCGNGEWLAIAKMCGWTGVGIEVDPRRAAPAVARGIVIWQGDVASYPGQPQGFDVVRLWHVLEHLPDPAATLRTVRDWLKPGGELIVGIPNIRSAAHRIFRRTWSGLEYPKHLYHFTAPAIERLVQSAGFVQIRVRHRSCGTCLDSLGLTYGPLGNHLARQPVVRLASIYFDHLLDMCRLGDAFDVRAIAPDAPEDPPDPRCPPCD